MPRGSETGAAALSGLRMIGSNLKQRNFDDLTEIVSSSIGHGYIRN